MAWLLIKNSIIEYIIMSEENISQEFKLKNIDDRNYLIEEINQNELMTEKHKNVYRVLKYIEQLYIVISTITGFVSNSAFACLVAFLIGITSSAIQLKICEITAGIKKYKSIIKKRKKKHDKILSQAKSKLKSAKVLFSKTLIDSNISHNELVLINNVPKEFHDMIKEVKIFNI